MTTYFTFKTNFKFLQNLFSMEYNDKRQKIISISIYNKTYSNLVELVLRNNFEFLIL
jgi:hypothetical protein